MEKRFCDRCGKEVTYDDSQKKCPDDERVAGLNNGAFGAELFKVVKVNDEVEQEHLYAASYQADLCRDCQTKLNVMVNQFIKGYEG